MVSKGLRGIVVTNGRDCWHAFCVVAPFMGFTLPCAWIKADSRIITVDLKTTGA